MQINVLVLFLFSPVQSVIVDVDWRLFMTTRDMSINVNDQVRFHWTGYHDVYEVFSQSSFDSCSLSGGTRVAEQSIDGEYIMTSTIPGTRYFVCSVGHHCNSLQKIKIRTINTQSPPPPSPQSSPPHTSTNMACDVTVIGCGLAGATAAVVSQVYGATWSQNVCIICPSVQGSTSVASGQGWLLIPSVEDKNLLLSELEAYSISANVGFDRERASASIDASKLASAFVHDYFDFSLTPVDAFEDVHTVKCKDMIKCCVNDTRHVENMGAYTCEYAKQWYKRSKCCHDASGSLDSAKYWPSYLHLRNALEGKVMQFKNGTQPMYIVDVITEFLELFKDFNGTHITSTVNSVKREGDVWKISSDIVDISSKVVVFANGGYGAEGTLEELMELGITDSKYVHARNTRLLKDLMVRNAWEVDEPNAWYLEFVDNQPKWFLWDDQSTVMSLDGTLLYDETMSYDERGRILRRKNISEAHYFFSDPQSTLTLNSEFPKKFADALLAQKVSKKCDSLSKRLWRNFLPKQYGIGTIVDKDACSSRITGNTPITIDRIHLGIIDTISGPKVRPDQSTLSAQNAFVCGNAGAPSLLNAYIAPGSTLGHAFVSGYTAGKHAIEIV